jgi:phosphoribosylanthranilate isomerase
VTDWLTVTSSLVLAVASGGGIATLITIPASRRKLTAGAGRDAAEAVERLSLTAVSTVEKLETQMERMDTMRQQISDMRRQLDAAESKAQQLGDALDAAIARAAEAEAERDRLRDEIAAKRRARDRRADGA